MECNTFSRGDMDSSKIGWVATTDCETSDEPMETHVWNRPTDGPGRMQDWTFFLRAVEVLRPLLVAVVAITEGNWDIS